MTPDIIHIWSNHDPLKLGWDHATCINIIIDAHYVVWIQIQLSHDPVGQDWGHNMVNFFKTLHKNNRISWPRWVLWPIGLLILMHGRWSAYIFCLHGFRTFIPNLKNEYGIIFKCSSLLSIYVWNMKWINQINLF